MDPADLAQAQHDLVPLPVQPDDLDRHLLPELDDVGDLPDGAPCELGDVDQGNCPIVATSFSDLLQRLLDAGGRNVYWLEDDFESLGDAYDGYEARWIEEEEKEPSSTPWKYPGYEDPPVEEEFRPRWLEPPGPSRRGI